MDGPLYFGCYRRPGHYLWGPGMQRVRSDDLPWKKLNGELAPPRARPGHAALHHLDGWTALAFWDRSVDSRPGSNSVFLFPDVLDFEEAVIRAVKEFPEVFEQMRCVILLGGASRAARSTSHPPPKWYVEEGFVVRGPAGEDTGYQSSREDALSAAWDAYEGSLQISLFKEEE